jgi:hypothetical protein
MFCTDAEPYYYDYLYGLDAGVPRAVADHIRQCAHCRTQVRRLEAAIAESEAQDRMPQGDMDVVGALGLHFAHLGAGITCAKARSFLPVLLVPSLEIRIPTPITVHVDHCRQCAEDLEKIRELELAPDQLSRLSRFYAAIQDEDPLMCRRARSKTWAFACASFEGIDAEVLDHMCACPRCRRRVYRCREKILAGRQPGDTIPGVGLCGGISMADLFEWVVPYGRPVQAAAGEGMMPSHIQACPDCIERMQSLHRTIYGIAERADSGVSTVYTTGSKAGRSGGQAQSLYGGYPVHVEVARREPEPAATRLRSITRIRAALKRGVANLQFRPVLGAGLFAAAVVPLAILLVISIRPASGISLHQLSDAVKGIENLHVKRYGADGTRLVHELWIARGSGLVVLRDARGDTLYDVKRLEKVIRYPGGGGRIERATMTREEQEGLDLLVDGVLGFLLDGAPSDRELQPLAPDAVEDAGPGTAAYERAWDSPSSDGLVLHNRQRAFLNPVTGLPEKIERSRLTPDDEQWRQMDVQVFEYPTRQKVELAIQGIFPGWRNQSGDQRGL